MLRLLEYITFCLKLCNKANITSLLNNEWVKLKDWSLQTTFKPTEQFHGRIKVEAISN